MSIPTHPPIGNVTPYFRGLVSYVRGTVTFERACQELHHRVEAMRVDDYLDSRPGRVLVSTEGKKNGQNAAPLVKLPCLAKDCAELIQPYLPLCKLCERFKKERARHKWVYIYIYQITPCSNRSLFQ